MKSSSISKFALTASIVLALTFTSAIAAKQTVAVLPSDGILNEDELKFLTAKVQEIAVSVLPRNNFDVFTQDLIIRYLGKANSYVKECKQSSCIVDLGRKASADYVAQCQFGKFGSDLAVTFELYKVNGSELIDKFSKTAKNINGLLAIIEERIPESFIKITSPTTETPPAKTPPAAPAPETINANQQKSSFTDNRDGKSYKIVKIGSQIWMAQNLDYHGEDGYLGLCYYDYPKAGRREPKNCEKYGRLYDWNEAMKACPKGWHLPNKEEWQTLVDFAGGEDVAGKKLRAKDEWGEYKCKYTETDNRGRVTEYDKCATDEYGFSALPGGYYDSQGGAFRTFVESGDYYSDGRLQDRGGKRRSVDNSGYWWSSEIKDVYYMSLSLHSGDPYRESVGVGRNNWNNFGMKRNLYSVRCVKDF